MDTYELLQTLTETPGPSGFEADVAAVIQQMWEPLVDSIEMDRTGSLIARKKGDGSAKSSKEKRPTILLATHMDELGLMVSQIIDFKGNGFLRVVELGGVDRRQLFGQQVVIHGFDRTEKAPRNMIGIIGSPPDRLLPAARKGKTFNFESYVVDPGLPYETLSRYISVGDAVSFRQPLRKLKSGRVTGKALDNRASVAALTLCLQALQNRPHDWDVLAVATCQEESGLLGAANTGYRYRPDIAVAIDVTFGKGPGATTESCFNMGGGPVVGFMPDTHPTVRTGLMKAAEGIEMKVQKEFASYPGGTDGYYLQIAAEGIPTGILSIPLRYMHTMVESISKKDVERTGRLLAEYILSLDEQTLERFAKEMMDVEEGSNS